MIAVLDYGIGNLRSAEKALIAVGADARLVTRAEDAKDAKGVVLPGVGAFGACAKALAASGLDAVARTAIETEKPFLGICVGFQLLFASSEESPEIPGLGVLPGVVRRLAGEEKLPQMQWNTVTPASTATMFGKDERTRWFYFVHSFAPLIPEGSGLSVSTCEYGGSVVAAVERGTCWGVQFHPEKSAHDGLALLRGFVEACGEVDAR